MATSAKLRRANSVSLVLVVSLLFLGTAGAALKNEELRLFQLLNQERIDNSLLPLQWNQLLYDTALQHSQEMLQYGYFSHTSAVDSSNPYDRVLKTGYYDGYHGTRVVKENLYIKSGLPDADRAHYVLMNSASHREAILSPDVNEVGIACASDSYKDFGESWDCDETFAYYDRGWTDSDKDGMADQNDACPDETENYNGYQDMDGCPDSAPDQDGDGIPDSMDNCPNEAEVVNGYIDGDGCPDVSPQENPKGIISLDNAADADGDGISNNLDQCQNEPETYNGYQDDDGCPDTTPSDFTETTDYDGNFKIDRAGNKSKIDFSSLAMPLILFSAFIIAYLISRSLLEGGQHRKI